MNGKLVEIAVGDFSGMLPSTLTPEETRAMIQVGRLSRPLWAGMWGVEPICFIGVVPATLLSDEVYLWCMDLPSARQHKIAFARHARRLIPLLRQRYTRITGHCLSPESWRWLRSLGAIPTSSQTFEIV